MNHCIGKYSYKLDNPAGFVLNTKQTKIKTIYYDHAITMDSMDVVAASYVNTIHEHTPHTKFSWHLENYDYMT